MSATPEPFDPVAEGLRQKEIERRTLLRALTAPPPPVQPGPDTDVIDQLAEAVADKIIAKLHEQA